MRVVKEQIILTGQLNADMLRIALIPKYEDLALDSFQGTNFLRACFALYTELERAFSIVYDPMSFTEGWVHILDRREIKLIKGGSGGAVHVIASITLATSE
mmetsp:Transcript_27406/g.66084  ORF Transcript_27406/g.66084 Transcript_27406/m.66084 type:complete len:101 (-) Transcript_27406:53-355(-)